MLYKGSDRDALRMLIDHEVAISDLYTAYAELFSDHGDYWNLLASEERQHADAISGLLEIVDGEVRVVETSGFKPIAIMTSIDYLRGHTSRARTSPVALPAALSIALDIEKAMIERKFFGIFDTAAPEARAVLKILEEGTHTHIETIEHEWRKYR